MLEDVISPWQPDQLVARGAAAATCKQATSSIVAACLQRSLRAAAYRPQVGKCSSAGQRLGPRLQGLGRSGCCAVGQRRGLGLITAGPGLANGGWDGVTRERESREGKGSGMMKERGS